MRPVGVAGTVGSPRIAVLRHGETEWSRTGRHTSTTDVELTPFGETQAARVPAVLAELGIRPQTVISSPRLRARRTAELAGFPDPRIDPDLAEWDYGDFEGLTSDEISVDHPGWTFVDGSPGGESAGQVGRRVDELLARLGAAPDGDSDQNQDTGGHPDGDTLLVCHGHISRVIAARWIGLPVEAAALLDMGPAHLTVLAGYRGRRILQHLNVPPLG